MEKINVLVMGNSGAGKSTLINGIFKFSRAVTGEGASVTKEMAIYENDEVPFRCIDTRGLEYGVVGQMKTRQEIRKWSKHSVANRENGKYIHLIWYCVDATSKRFFQKNLEALKFVTQMWKDIPVIIVLTKSYSQCEREENETMIRQAIARYEKKHLNVQDVISVVAKPFPIHEELILPAFGLEELVEKTNQAAPEALRLNEEAVGALQMSLRRGNANGMTALAATGAAVVGAVPFPFADSPVLMAIQSGLVLGIAKVYKIKGEEYNFQKIAQAIILNGGVSMGAKGLLSMLKAVPGLNVAAAVLNAAVAGVVTAVIGEIAIVIMEKISKGELKTDDFDWIGKFADQEFGKRAEKYVKKLGADLKDKQFQGKDPGKIGKMIGEMFTFFNRRL